DPAGNRVMQAIDPAGANIVTTYAYNAASQLESESTPLEHDRLVTYGYDEWANQTARSTRAGSNPNAAASREAFGYNYLNLLDTYRSAVRVSGGSTSPRTWRYDYWPTGERASKTSLAASETTSQLYVPRFGDVATEYLQ